MQIVRDGVRFRKQQNRTLCAELWGKHCRALLTKRASHPQEHSAWTLGRQPRIHLFIPYAATQGAPEMMLRHGPCSDQGHTQGSDQFSSVAQSCLTLCDPMDCSTAWLPCLSPTPGVHSNSCPLSW